MSHRFKFDISGFLRGLVLALVVSVPCCATAALTAEAGKTAWAIDPKADEVIGQMSDLLRKAKSFSVDLDMVMITRMQGMKQEMQSAYSVAVLRPNRFAIVLKEGMMGATAVSDGIKLYTCMPMLNRYTETDAPVDLGTTMTGCSPAMSAMGGVGGVGFVGPLLASNPRELFLEGVTTATYTGTEKLESGECHHLKFVQDQCDWDMWVQVGKQPLVRKVMIDMTKSVSKSLPRAQFQEGTAAMFTNMQMIMVLEFKNWTLNSDLPASRFYFVPPEGVKKAESLFGGRGGDEETNPLVGKPAPAFKLESLDGGQINLDDAKGKRVVILDFWASWCGPCTKALPLLAEVAKDYQGKGVVLYAVNQKENSTTIKNFLKDKNIAVTVALDAKGEVGGLYGVEGIPQTVIIDTQGVVQAVHVGLLPNLKHQLSDELDKILAGQSLAATQPKVEEPSTLKGLAQVWTLAGRWNGIAADPGWDGAYVLANDGTCARVNAEGKVAGNLKYRRLVQRYARRI